MKSNSIIRTAMVLFLAMFTTTVWADVNFGNVFEKEETEVVTYTKGQQATIILPVTPDAGKGKYYRLDRVEDYQIIFEEEPHPQARVPYIIIPNEDFSIDVSTLDFTGIWRDSTNIYGVSFIGTYVKDVIGYKDSYYYYTIDATSDCRNDMNRYNVYVGALRAFIQVRIWNNGEKMPIVIHDAGSEPIIINGTYPTFIDEGNEWHYANICEMVDTSIVVEENFAKYYFKGDTIINQKKYKQLWGDFIYRNTESHPKKKPGTSYGSGYVMGVREEEGKVFVNVEEYDKQLMMFSYEEQKWNLTKEDDEYILYDFNSPSNYVIPEVGSKLDLIFPYPLQRMDYWDGIIRTWNLNLFYCDGQLIYKSQNYYPDLFFLIDGIAINETNFPDENFRNYLLSQEYGADSLLTDDEISGITELSVSGKNITSLQGIEYFTALTLLSCTHNQLFLLDVSKNTALKSLGCSYNQLISLDVSKNTKLTGLYCGRNQLTSLDVSKNAVLTELYCFNNKLTTLDVSKNTALKSLGCSENQLTSLDVSKNTALSLLACQYNDIHDAAMDTLVAGLSASTKGTMHALVADSEGEHNVMTVKQVAAAKVKGWTVLAYNGGEWADYDGSEPTPQDDYRQFVEDGKVWKVGIWSGNPVQMVEYFYFDGDTIVDGKACKRMWCQQYGNEGSWYFDGLYRGEEPNKQLYYIGVFYEEDKKVYFQPWEDQLGGLYANDFWLLYDFSVMPGDTIFDYVMTAKASGGMPEFKGTYYDLTPYTEPKEYEEPLWNNRWLEGVGRADVPYYNLYNGETGHYTFLMSCTVGDEVIYLNDEYEDGATPSMETKKRRFDFTHTVKIQPKTPSRRGEETALYGEYSDRLLDIRLDPLDAAYSVCITNQKTGETLYEKNINAGSIVALNIDISKYPEGQYKISIDNSNETFNGVFDTSATEIENLTPTLSKGEGAIFNLNGQRINGLQKGLNIVGGKKIFVK